MGISPFKDSPPSSPQELAALQAKGEEAWRAKRYERVLEIYSVILQGQALTREAKLTALERQAKAALSLGRHQESLDALGNWAQVDARVRNTWEWNSIYVQALSGQGRERQAEEVLAKLIQARGADFELTGPASIELAKRYAMRDLAAQAARTLRAQHAKAPDRAARARFESDTVRMLASLEPRGLSALAGTLNEANQNAFPYGLIAFEEARRSGSGRLSEIAERLARSSDLADRDLPRRIVSMGLGPATAGVKDAPPLPGGVQEVQPGTLAVALLLPQTGQLRALAGRVLAGANAAKAQLASQGVQMDIRVINTDDPNYADHLAALPYEVSIVGGPMHSSYFKSLAASGELARRVFLTFMPETAEAEEGRQVWRLFWSAQDEAQAVAGTPLDAGVRRFGVFYPEDRMGKKLADAFATAVSAKGGEVTAMQPYPPQDQSRWGDVIKNMVKAQPKAGEGKNFSVNPGFDALFIPDDLARAEHILGQLQFYQADSLVILGPQLWASALTSPKGRPRINQTYFRYAFCPGAWWPQSNSRAVADLKAQMAKSGGGETDFWTALGYDFVRLAAAAGAVPSDTAPAEVSKRLNDASAKIEWAMAPVTWDAAGHARMAMYFFRPSVEGVAQVEREGFRERFEALKNRPQQPPQQ